MSSRSILMGAGVAALFPLLAGAQTCVGAASFATTPYRVGAGYASTNNAKTYGVDFADGASLGWYGSAGLSRVEYTDIDNTGTAVSFGGGYAMPLESSPSEQFCPQVAYAYQSGPDIDTGFGTVSTSIRAFSFGGAFGNSMPMSPTLDFIPFGSFDYVIANEAVSGAGSTSQDYGQLGLGAGFVIDKTLTLQPMVLIPVGLPGGKSTVQLALAYSFGGNTQPAQPASRRR